MNEIILLSLTMYGLAIVISMFVALVIWGIGVSISSQTKREAPGSKVTMSAPVVDEAEADIAAIAAAVYAMLGAHRIVHIEDVGRGLSWTAEGRWMHQTSHKVTPR